MQPAIKKDTVSEIFTLNNFSNTFFNQPSQETWKNETDGECDDRRKNKNNLAKQENNFPTRCFQTTKGMTGEK